MCVNPHFEGSLSYDGVRDIGFISVENAPLKRAPQTDVLIWRPLGKQRKECMSEFTEPDTEDMDGVTSIKGHERTYYHARNNQKMHSLAEYDAADEDNKAPDWLVDRTRDLIEDFTDVNEGEKMLMKMWNIHILKNGYIADFTVSDGCLSFVAEYGRDIVTNNLMRNFLIHLNCMIEFQVIPQTTVVKAMEALFKVQRQMVAEGHSTAAKEEMLMEIDPIASTEKGTVKTTENGPVLKENGSAKENSDAVTNGDGSDLKENGTVSVEKGDGTG